MALRNILTKEQPGLYKHCRPVKDFNPRLHQLLDDMRETLMEANGVGLAAPQVGVLRRAVLVIETNVPEGESEKVIELINPEIVETSGEQDGPEGCLSVPGRRGEVPRYQDIDIAYTSPYTLQDTTERVMGFTAVIFQHECDHLDGILYIDYLD